MKKIILSLIVAMISITSFAQQPGGQRREFKPEEMAKRRADNVKESAKINDEQYKKVYDLFLKQAKDQQAKMKEGQQGNNRQRFNREEMQKQQDATNKELKAILTPEQYKAYDKAQKERRQRFGQRGRGGDRGGFGGPGGNRGGQRPQRNR